MKRHVSSIDLSAVVLNIAIVRIYIFHAECDDLCYGHSTATRYVPTIYVWILRERRGGGDTISKRVRRKSRSQIVPAGSVTSETVSPTILGRTGIGQMGGDVEDRHRFRKTRVLFFPRRNVRTGYAYPSGNPKRVFRAPGNGFLPRRYWFKISIVVAFPNINCRVRRSR